MSQTKYTVTITVTAQQVIEIEAANEQEALTSAQDLFDFDQADILEFNINAD